MQLPGFHRNKVCESFIQKFLVSSPEITRPTAIQKIIIPAMNMNAHNLLIDSTTLSGKSTGVILGFFARYDPMIEHPQQVIICPTKEMVRSFGGAAHRVLSNKNVGLFSAGEDAQRVFNNTKVGLVTSDNGKDDQEKKESDTIAQVESLRKTQLVIATPGHLLKLIRRADKMGTPINWSHLKTFVIDEIDKGVEAIYHTNNFKSQIYEIFELVAPKIKDHVQMVVLSATITNSVQDYIERKSVDRHKPNLPDSCMAKKSNALLFPTLYTIIHH
jgi:superfamily II DNA/RNA helicase